MSGARPSRGWPLIALLVLLALAAAPSSGAASTQSGSSTSQKAYPTSSWALGVVAPQGARLADGASLRWEAVSNVTALLTLPNISRPDAIVYAVVSVMASGGTVLQAAAGVYPGSSLWLAYSQWISGVGSGLATYNWLVNGTGPPMTPGSSVSISIFLSASGWHMRVEDEGTGTQVSGAFPSSIPATLAKGDQEAFALESYSRSSATFGEMGNLTLAALMLNGQAVTGGLYSYGDWDMVHNPVFAVGSSGTSPPGFLSLEILSGRTCVWSYSGVWRGGGGLTAGLLAYVALPIAALVAILVVVLLTRKPRPSPS